jgi:hypothetical protein
MDLLDNLLVDIDPERQIELRNLYNNMNVALTAAQDAASVANTVPATAPAPAPVFIPVPAMTQPTQREVDADRRDLARTINQILKPQRPEPYAGEIDADGCNNFIDNQKEYFTIVDLALSDWVQYTALNLKSDAKSWWRASGLTIATPWHIFEDAFLTFHTPPNAIAAAREAMESLKQGKRSVAQYTHEFRRLQRRVPSLDIDTALHWYVKGLESNTSKEVKLRQPHDLEHAIHQASLVHSILFPEFPTLTTTAPKSDSAMDIDNLHVAINNLTTQVNNLSRNNGFGNSTHATPRPPKLTPEDKAYLIAKKGCFRCRRIGHMASQCRAFPTQQQPRQFNNIEVAAVSASEQVFSQTQSGKATGN